MPHSSAVSLTVPFAALCAVILGPPWGCVNDHRARCNPFSSGQRGLGRVSDFTDTDDTHNNYHWEYSRLKPAFSAWIAHRNDLTSYYKACELRLLVFVWDTKFEYSSDIASHCSSKKNHNPVTWYNFIFWQIIILTSEYELRNPVLHTWRHILSQTVNSFADFQACLPCCYDFQETLYWA